MDAAERKQSSMDVIQIDTTNSEGRMNALQKYSLYCKTQNSCLFKWANCEQI